MRRIFCDQYEFETPSSEESLEIAIAAPSRHCPDLSSLLSQCGASSTQGPEISEHWSGWNTVFNRVERFAGMAMPVPIRPRNSVLLQENWDEIEIGVSFGSVILWYHWLTTA